MQTAHAFGKALTDRIRRTHADTVRNKTARIYWYDVLVSYGLPFCTPVCTVEATLPTCDEAGCDCSREAALEIIADKPRQWQRRADADRIRVERTCVNPIFEGPNGPHPERQN
ncbi:hypothetical protein [Streptomyces rubradiris]|uniref:hypothetical protein n=1 Tax=Streptomyces rubradiris TaxID=285531 RepID=UPI001672BCB6|nr:hypothetical protein [Streptomyces rubradiris]GHH25602.1 hypothetical protein GCM10018792_64770 [Streptomyces rubradiris]